jgi:hypothetical protein
VVEQSVEPPHRSTPLPRTSRSSRQQLIEHLEASWQEYNELYAHPITWSWTRQKMHRWVEQHAS